MRHPMQMSRRFRSVTTANAINMFSWFTDRFWTSRLQAVTSVVPEGYINFRATDAHVSREGSGDSPWKAVGNPGAVGLRWHHGPLWFEGYYGDTEPMIEPFPHLRFITWQPTTCRVVPRGWYRFWAHINARMTGFAEIHDPDRYTDPWSSHAKRHLRRWQKTQAYELVTMSFEEFCVGYREARMSRWLKYLFIDFLRKKIARHGERVEFFGARERASGRFVAGFAVGDVPETRCSVHLASFILPEAESTSVGVGMVDEWFRRSIAKGIRFLDFDIFWAPGDPKDWKGFSRFKQQFGVTFIRYSKPFVRVVWGRKI